MVEEEEEEAVDVGEEEEVNLGVKEEEEVLQEAEVQEADPGATSPTLVTIHQDTLTYHQSNPAFVTGLMERQLTSVWSLARAPGRTSGSRNRTNEIQTALARTSTTSNIRNLFMTWFIVAENRKYIL